MKYDAIIGLEIHAELNTKSKMFCSCDNCSEGKAPNTTVCPVCLGHPGTLPVPNKAAIEATIMAGLALSCSINRLSKFDRKNYFYPDLPKGYQISQYDLPLAYNGCLDVDGEKIAITRIHLEEDTGKSSHPSDSDYTLLDFNRAGTPLIELVSEPVIKDAAQARKFCQAYQQILRYLDVSRADMEKGEMRCEANISVQKKGCWEYRDGKIEPKNDCELSAKVEVKNLNSFRSVERAIKFEIERQISVIEGGAKVMPETRGFNENNGETVSQRVKESSADYRYFPEPDIPPMSIDENLIAELYGRLPELPLAKQARFEKEYAFPPALAATLCSDKELADFSERVISELDAWIEANGDSADRQEKKLARMAGNLISGELLKHLNAENKNISQLKITPENLAELACLLYQGKINSSAGQTIFAAMYKNGGDPSNIMRELKLEQLDDKAALEEMIRKVVADNPRQAAEYRNGKSSLLQFFVGKAMAESGGKANPQSAKELLETILAE